MPQWMPAARNPCGAVIPRREDAVVNFLAMIERDMFWSMCTRSLLKHYCGTVEIQWCAHLGQQESTTQDAQKGHPLRPSFVSRLSSFASIDFPACEIRFTRDASRDTVFALADFFSILLGIGSGSRQPCLLREAQHEVHGLNGLACGTFHKIIQRGDRND